MSETTNHHNQDPSQVPVSPETTLILNKGIQQLSAEILSHASERYLKSLQNTGSQATTFHINEGDKVWGDLTKWSGDFFSFADLDIPPQTESDDLEQKATWAGITINPDPHPWLPEGTSAYIIFNCRPEFGQEGQVIDREVALRKEGPPQVIELVKDTQNPDESPQGYKIKPWRDMTELEAHDLLQDVASLITTTKEYFTENPDEVLW